MALSSQPLKSVMRHPVFTVDPHVTAADALELAREKRVHHLPVMAQGALVGMVCTCDLQDVSAATPVQSAMNAPAITLDLENTTLEAARKIRDEGVGAVIVVDEAGRPSGIVTRGDLLVPEGGAPEAAVAEVLEDCRCVCCGLTRHLRTDDHGQTLCIYCHERATDGSWLELGVGD